jgi:hypothetical protein
VGNVVSGFCVRDALSVDKLTLGNKLLDASGGNVKDLAGNYRSRFRQTGLAMLE